MGRISLGRAVFVACLLALIAGQALAQGFPARPLRLNSPFAAASTPDQQLRAFAQIASKYLGQLVMVENRPGAIGTLAPAEMARTAPPDGYILSMLSMTAFRVPHMARVTWDPLKDFTYIIGLADFNHGVVVKSDSRFKTLNDLIDYAKANPGRLLYSSPAHGFRSHLVMEELGLKAGANFVHVPGGPIAKSAAALIDGRIMAISDTSTNWGRTSVPGPFGCSQPLARNVLDGTRRQPGNWVSTFSRIRRSALWRPRGWIRS